MSLCQEYKSQERDSKGYEVGSSLLFAYFQKAKTLVFDFQPKKLRMPNLGVYGCLMHLGIVQPIMMRVWMQLKS